MLATASRRWRELALTPELWPRTVDGVRARTNHEALLALQRRAEILDVPFRRLILSNALTYRGQWLRLPVSLIGPVLIDQAFGVLPTRVAVYASVLKVHGGYLAGDTPWSVRVRSREALSESWHQLTKLDKCLWDIFSEGRR